MTEPKGHYEKKGDVEEWVWDKDPGLPKQTGGWVVPEAEFDPRAEVDTRSASEKLAEEAQRPGFTVAEEEAPKEEAPKKVTTKTAAPLTGKK
jgi:hypothetical protein